MCKCVVIGNGVFILAYARRNVYFHKVLEVAAAHGLKGVLLDPGVVADNQEPIYTFTYI